MEEFDGYGNDSVAVAKLLTGFHYDSDKTEEVLNKYEILCESDNMISEISESHGYGNDSVAVANLIAGFHYDPDRTEEILNKYKELCESDDRVYKVKLTRTKVMRGSRKNGK